MEIENEKYTDESIAFVLEQAEKLLKETFKTFRELTNKSYITFAFYISFLSYCFNKIIDEKPFSLTYSVPFFIMILGLIFCIIILWKNLFPSNMSFPGSKPNVMIHPYFETFKDQSQLREYQNTKISDYNNGIKSNNEQADIIISRFKNSVLLLLLIAALAAITAGIIWFGSA
jgi:hypothetical protein